MRKIWARGGISGLLLSIALPCVAAQRRTKPHRTVSGHTLVRAPLTPRERAEQLLDRFTYGPRPGEIDRVLAQGENSWFEQQLHPSLVPDAALDRRLADLPTVAMTPAEALAAFPDRHQVTQVADGRAAVPTDPLQRAVMEVLVARLDAAKDRKKPDGTVQVAPEMTAERRSAEKSRERDLAARYASDLLALPAGQRMAALIALPIADRVALTETGNLPPEERQQLIKDLPPREREAIQAMTAGANSSVVLSRELPEARMLRDILSERQLQTVMTDLWFNHFNVTLEKGADRWYTATYEREAIRPHALGKFSDLLLATATSPAMMVYLDNLQSIGPDSVANGVHPDRPNSARGTKGLNENYGREVMELHTVGVDGGYTQADVASLAAILTGWGVDRPQDGGGFLFEPKRHEPGSKAWFGYCLTDEGKATKLPPNGAATCERATGPATAASMQQGIAALKLLAASPQTAHAIAHTLAQYFVADTPPPALVNRLTQVYITSDGDITAMLRALVSSSEFNSRQYFHSKVKTPVEFLASAYRSTATDPQNVGAIVNVARTMGMPVYGALPPTGYYLTAEQWMNSTALVDRLNFAYQLSSGKLPHQAFDGSRVLAAGLLASHSLPTGMERSIAVQNAVARPAILHASSAVESADASGLKTAPVTTGIALATQLLAEVVTGGPVSASTTRLIETQVGLESASRDSHVASTADTATSVNLIVGLLLGSPEFQLR